ncbi:MAG: RluA family pseudouridine synthase [Bacteroidetes bacterium]|nr:RluA family pseudouridine synthase [Bacteroidota bacterium]MDA1120557.1 RluA family pseudouridine synthase [Bacteroidota bacterium]
MTFQTDVLFEDNHLLVVNKPAGVLVQGDKTGDKPLVELCKAYIKKKYDKPGAVFLGVTHRLDRPVSGVVVFAKTSKALTRMNKLFESGDVKKTYWAIVRKRPPEDADKLVHWLSKNEKTNVTKARVKQYSGGLRSELHYKLIGQIGQHYLLEVNPLTGRPHQIRVQLSSIGCPIKGDLKYGYPKPNPDGNIGLHSVRIEFIHPIKMERIEIKAPLTKNDIWAPFVQLVG